MIKLIRGALLLTPFLLFACSDDTVSVGSDIVPSADRITASTGTYSVVSRSIAVDSVLANTSTCLLGSVVDPETRTKTTCNFLAQFHMSENSIFPDQSKLVMDNGVPEADSCLIALYFNEYYGDSLTTMKVRVQELDTAKVMEESQAYYTNLDPADYVNENGYSQSFSYSVQDLTTPYVQGSYTYAGKVTLRLSKEYGTYIMQQYYAHPEYFKNSYTFIHHVCPGFYFETTGGVGSMLNIDISALDVYFRYHTVSADTGNDTIEVGMRRMAATEEVIQNTNVANTIPVSMLDSANEYTYVKAPGGIFTEVDLPIGEVVSGEHYGDSINTAKISFTRYNTESSGSALEPPATLLLVRKGELFSFFENGDVADSKTSYLADYSSSDNAYVFTNLSRLFTLLKQERNEGAGVSGLETEAEREALYAAWEAKNPDWNKVVLVPVNTEYSTSTSALGTTTKTLLRVRNDMSLSSARLVGGPSGNITLEVVYSDFPTD